MRDAMLRRAFQLSYFVHGKRELAVQIATAAMSKLNAAAVAQNKRSYYKPGSRSRVPGSKAIRPRTKVSLSELHLLQRLVYVESELYERQGEQIMNAAIDEEMLITHYVKHLISITLMRNSFHVTLGMSRLLYNYTTAESMRIYDLIIQDPERAKDDAYWRARKARLMRELKERFGQLKVVRGLYGEERFETLEDSTRYLKLVNRCLQMFTPWDTSCPLPGSGAAPVKIEALTFHGSDPDEEHQIEVARMHAVIHPDCYERLAAGLGLAHPAKRLDIPKFFPTSGGEDDPRSDRHQTAEPTEDELTRMRRELDDQSARRKRSGGANRLRVIVDGVERTVLGVDRNCNEVSFDVEEGSKLIEVRTRCEEGDLLLAIHALDYDDTAPTADPSRYSTEYGSGQKICFTISSLRQLREEDGTPVFGFSVVVSHEEMNIFPALARAWRLLGFFPPQRRRPRRWASAWVLTVVLVSVGISGLAWFLIVGERTSQLAENDPDTIASPSPSNSPADAQPSATVSPNVRGPQNPSHSAKASDPALKATPDILRGEIRVSASLIEVKKICVEVTGDRDVDPAIIEYLRSSLQGSRRWTTVMRDKADALLSVAGGSDGREIYVRVINQVGKTLWPRAGDDSARKYGATAEEAAKIVADLLADLRELERKRRGQ
jgi:hypothetical protein